MWSEVFLLFLVRKRFIGSLKKEYLLTEDFENLQEVNEFVKRYREFYNKERPHQSLDYRTLFEYYQREVKKWKNSQNLFLYIYTCPKNGGKAFFYSFVCLFCCLMSVP